MIAHLFNSHFLKDFFILPLAVVGLHCCTRAFSSCGEQGALFVAMRGFSLWWLLLLWRTGSRFLSLQHVGSRALAQ